MFWYRIVLTDHQGRVLTRGSWIRDVEWYVREALHNNLALNRSFVIEVRQERPQELPPL